MKTLSVEHLLQLNGACCLSKETLETAEWMRAAGIGAYSPEVDPVVAAEVATEQAAAVAKGQRMRGRRVAEGGVYAAAHAVAAAMMGVEPAYGGSK